MIYFALRNVIDGRTQFAPTMGNGNCSILGAFDAGGWYPPLQYVSVIACYIDGRTQFAPTMGNDSCSIWGMGRLDVFSTLYNVYENVKKM